MTEEEKIKWLRIRGFFDTNLNSKMTIVTDEQGNFRRLEYFEIR